MHEFVHEKKASPHYSIDHRQWENDIDSFIPVISIVLQVHYYSEALPTTVIDTVSEFTRRSAKSNC